MGQCELLMEAVKKNPNDGTLRSALVEELDLAGRTRESAKWNHVSAALYPDCVDQESFYGPSDYTPIIESLGEVLVRMDQDDYQGSTWVLLKAGRRYGYLTFGWGSCSGCISPSGGVRAADVMNCKLVKLSMSWTK